MCIFYIDREINVVKYSTTIKIKTKKPVTFYQTHPNAAADKGLLKDCFI